MAMKNWSCSVTTAICNVPWFKTDIIHYYIYLFSLLFSLFLHRKGSLVEKIILTVCWCLDVWDDCFWKNLISKLFCKTNTYIFFFLLSTAMAVLCLLFSSQNSMLPWFPNIFFLRGSWLWLMEADRLTGMTS